MTNVEKTKQVLNEIISFIDKSPWRDAYHNTATFLVDKVSMPCELAVAGRVKAGKSSFLNALLGQDLAMVGTTETTATINYFRYGTPKDDDHPVLVVWEDGREEWQTKAFLDSLQGNTPEIIKKASAIDHLEYYVLNDILRDITLVDTPGTNATVDEHNQRTEDYFTADLRSKHNKQSVRLKEKADAVIMVVGHVEKAQESEVIASFTNDTSAFNAIGVMSKIDNEKLTAEEWRTRCGRYAASVKQYLNTIMPVSASLYSSVNKLKRENKLERLQTLVRQVPEQRFERLFGTSVGFFADGEDNAYNKAFIQYGLPLSVRHDISVGMDFPVFYRIAKELYYNDIDIAIKNLIEFSSMEKLRTTLKKQFLDRSRDIRCSKVLKDAHALLSDMQNRCLYSLRSNTANRNAFIDIIDAYPYYSALYEKRGRSQTIQEVLEGNRLPSPYLKNDVLDSLREFVKMNINTKELYDQTETELNALLRKVEELQLSFEQTDKKTEALMLLEQTKGLTEKEREELECLFGKYAGRSIADLNLDAMQRMRYWRGRKQFFANKPSMISIIDNVIFTYSQTINKE